ncbi:hypothetical protein GCM10010302_63510 [Streptomyces polychromogenes]|uniref:Uncharacterized protein n=1 Tax=Streptomyces polychromogenes TaxID=67342 RepID=A0ABP3FHQ6_9ACTN
MSAAQSPPGWAGTAPAGAAAGSTATTAATSAAKASRPFIGLSSPDGGAHHRARAPRSGGSRAGVTANVTPGNRIRMPVDTPQGTGAVRVRREPGRGRSARPAGPGGIRVRRNPGSAWR